MICAIDHYVIRPDRPPSTTITHTTLTNPLGNDYNVKLCVPPEKEVDFLRLVARGNRDGSKLGLIEQHPKINCCPITIDLDFRFPLDMDELRDADSGNVVRFCSPNHITRFIELVHRKYVEYLSIRGPVEYYITRRPTPIFDEAKNLIVDGVHI